MNTKINELLEIGNVLSHYFKWDHDVVDKYEKVEGVINEDVVDFRPSKKYDINCQYFDFGTCRFG